MRKYPLLVAFLGATAIGVWLMSRSESASEKPAKLRTERPTFPSPIHAANQGQLPSLLAHSDDVATERTMHTDPFLDALPPDAKTVVVFDAAAVRESPVGQLLMKCLNDESDRGSKAPPSVAEFFTRTDRIAIADNLMLATGHFAGFPKGDWSPQSAGSRAYGERGKILNYDPEESNRRTVALVDESTFVTGPTRSAVESSIDRLEGRARNDSAAMTTALAYGDIYGIVDASHFKEVFPDKIASVMREVANNVELHIDTENDVLIVADFKSNNPKRLEELGRLLVGAISAGRLEALVSGDRELGQLLDYAQIKPQFGELHVEVALPLSFVAGKLGTCANREPAPSQAAVAPTTTAQASLPVQNPEHNDPSQSEVKAESDTDDTDEDSSDGNGYTINEGPAQTSEASPTDALTSTS
jgi:hypothetical protein